MARELSYVLINPYTIAKSRTGGVIARYIARSELNFVAARMFGPSDDLVQRFADVVRKHESGHVQEAHLLADYVRKAYAPNPATGRPRRVMLLLFEGDDAIRRIQDVTGNSTLQSGSGQTVRDTYGDYVLDDHGKVVYFEPAVLVPSSRDSAACSLNLWTRHTDTCGGLTSGATDVPEGAGVQKTLVMLKPDNFRFRSLRPGNIIDLLSSSGLRIIGVKKFSMTVAQAERFYGPVREALEAKFRDIGGTRVADALAREFGFTIPTAAMDVVCDQLAPLFATSQFESIVKFMTGYKPSECQASEKAALGIEECLALVYEGEGAVRKIRTLLGPTDPSKAAPGSVRREFGSDIMVNAAHASDSSENAEREMAIIDFEADAVRWWFKRYYGSPVKRLLASRDGCSSSGLLRRIKARAREESAAT